jgi:hypothetical protein
MGLSFEKRQEMENIGYFARLRGVPSGFVVCARCDGEGSGEVKCRQCAGVGQYEQECCECGSFVDKDCRACDGTGAQYRDCAQCAARGYHDDNQPRPTADGTLPLPMSLGGLKLVKGKRR